VGYRIKPFISLLTSSILTPKTTNIDGMALGVEGQLKHITAPNIERATRFFPLVENETILNASDQCDELRKILDSVKVIFFQPSNKEQFHAETKIEELTKLFQSTQSNDARFFPQLERAPNSRQEAYKILWTEILTLARRGAVTPSHVKVLKAIEKFWSDLSYDATAAPKIINIDITENEDTATETVSKKRKKEDQKESKDDHKREKDKKKENTKKDKKERPKNLYQLYTQSRIKKFKDFDAVYSYSKYNQPKSDHTSTNPTTQTQVNQNTSNPTGSAQSQGRH